MLLMKTILGFLGTPPAGDTGQQSMVGASGDGAPSFDTFLSDEQAAAPADTETVIDQAVDQAGDGAEGHAAVGAVITRVEGTVAHALPATDTSEAALPVTSVVAVLEARTEQAELGPDPLWRNTLERPSTVTSAGTGAAPAGMGRQYLEGRTALGMHAASGQRWQEGSVPLIDTGLEGRPRADGAAGKPSDGNEVITAVAPPTASPSGWQPDVRALGTTPHEAATRPMGLVAEIKPLPSDAVLVQHARPASDDTVKRIDPRAPAPPSNTSLTQGEINGPRIPSWSGTTAAGRTLPSGSGADAVPEAARPVVASDGALSGSQHSKADPISVERPVRVSLHNDTLSARRELMSAALEEVVAARPDRASTSTPPKPTQSQPAPNTAGKTPADTARHPANTDKTVATTVGHPARADGHSPALLAATKSLGPEDGALPRAVPLSARQTSERAIDSSRPAARTTPLPRVGSAAMAPTAAATRANGVDMGSAGATDPAPQARPIAHDSVGVSSPPQVQTGIEQSTAAVRSPSPVATPQPVQPMAIQSVRPQFAETRLRDDSTSAPPRLAHTEQAAAALSLSTGAATPSGPVSGASLPKSPAILDAVSGLEVARLADDGALGASTISHGADGAGRLTATAPTAVALPSADPTTVVRQVLDAIRAAGAGDHVSLRLDPPELGALEIDLAVENGRMTATISAERQDTMDMLRRHADLLQRELDAAGYGETDVAFSEHGAQEDGERDAPVATPESGAETINDDTPSLVRGPILADGRLDLRM